MSVHLEVDFSELENMVASVNEAIASFARGDAMAAVGSVMENQTRKRIDSEKTAPDGQRWANWSDSYARTRHNGHSLLVNEGKLLDSIRHEADGNSASVGSVWKYAAVHQAGIDMTIRSTRRRVTIPARPFIGLSSENEEEIVATVNEFLQRKLGN